MSGDQRGIVSGFVAPFVEEAAAQASRPPHVQRQSRAGYGGSVLSVCYVTLEIYGPLAPWPVDSTYRYAWWGFAALGIWWLLSGLFGGPRGPLVGGLGLFVEAAGASWLLWKHIYPADMPRATFLLHALYLAVLWSTLPQLATALIGPQRNMARGLVDENIIENDFDWDRV